MPRPPDPGHHVPDPSIDRRSFLHRAAVGGVLVAGGAVLVPAHRFLPAAGAQTGGDATLAAFAESVELVAVTAYGAGMELLSDDLAPVLQTFAGHHEAHAEVWAAVAGEVATGRPNDALLAALTPAIESFGGQSDVLRFARDLENQLSVTCGYLLTTLQDADAVAAVATIHPVESSHAATLAYELDEGPEAWFPFGALESADPALGLDPAVFAVGPS